MALVAGTNTQPAIPGITGVEAETTVNVQFTNATGDSTGAAAGSVTRSVTSNPSAVRVRISVPALKVINPTTGVATFNNVAIKVERKHATYTSGAWEAVVSGGPGTISGGPYSTKYTKTYRIETPAVGIWDIRVSRVDIDDPDVYHLSQTWWDAYTEIQDVILRRPNRAAFAIRVNATQFQSIPKATLHMRGVQVQVPANYTPASYNWDTKVWTAAIYATTGPGTSGGTWDGTFQTLWTDNPAWVFYDAATNTRYGAGSFLQASALDKWALYTISQWCDEMVDGEPRMTCNLYLQGAQTAIKALGQLASVFWGVLYYASGIVTPVADFNDQPDALFTNANVEDGKFTYQGTARQARHTACVVSFTNPDLGYDQDTAVYNDDAGIARYGYNVLDYQGIGCASMKQALRLAKQAVLSELMQNEVVSFTSGLVGSTTAPGKIIQIADQFRAGNTRAGGVILAAITNTITLDSPVVIGDGYYTLRVQTATGMESSHVTNGPGSTSILNVSPAFSSAPPVGAGWLLQGVDTDSLWRVLSVKKGDGLKHEITALKHVPAKYALI